MGVVAGGSSASLGRGAVEFAQELFVVADLGGDGFESVAELVELDGETGKGEGVLAPSAMLVDDGVQLGAAIEGGPADPGASRDRVEGDLLAGGDQIEAGLFDAGHAVVAHPA